jgi:hypothetical protein
LVVDVDVSVLFEVDRFEINPAFAATTTPRAWAGVSAGLAWRFF